MVFDGVHALVTGDYIRPKTGEYAGQLGPWARLVGRLGIDPMSTFMKSAFIFWGLAGMVVTLCFALHFSWGWKAMLTYNICSIWYLFMGTASSILQIILLLVIRFLA